MVKTCVLFVVGAFCLGAAFILLVLWLAVRRFTLRIYRGPRRAGRR